MGKETGMLSIRRETVKVSREKWVRDYISNNGLWKEIIQYLFFP